MLSKMLSKCLKMQTQTSSMDFYSYALFEFFNASFVEADCLLFFIQICKIRRTKINNSSKVMTILYQKMRANML